MNARLRSLAVALLVASGAGPALAAPGVFVSEDASGVLHLRVAPSPEDYAAVRAGRARSTGFLLAVPGAAEPRLRIARSVTVEVAEGELPDDLVPALAIRPLRLAERALVGARRVVRVEVSPYTRGPGGRILEQREIVAELRFDGWSGSAGVGAGRMRAVRSGALRLPEGPPHGGDGDPVLGALRAAVVNPDDLVALPARPARPAQATTASSCSGCVKAVVSRDGLYRIRYEDLAALDPSWSGADPAQVHVLFDGAEVPVDLDDLDGSFGPGDQIVFLGLANAGLVTRENVYWIVPPDGRPGSRIRRSPAFASGDQELPAVAVVRGTLRFEQQALHYGKMPGPPDRDPWMSVELVSVGSSAEVTLPDSGPGLDAPDLTRPAPATSYRFRARVVGRVGSSIADDQEVISEVNGKLAADQAWRSSIEIEKLYDVGFDPTSLQASGNRLRVLQPPASDPLKVRANFVDWVELDYPRRLLAHGGILDFGDNTPAALYHAAGFSRSDARIYVFDGVEATRLIGPRVIALGPGMPMTLAFAWRRSAEAVGPLRVLASEPDALLAPDRLLRDEPSDIRGAPGAAWLAVSHPRFIDEARRLAAWRGGMAVSLEDVYDEFSNGIERPEAVRELVRWALESWPTPPARVALIGDASFDPMNHQGLVHPDYDPPSLLHTLDVKLESALELRAASDAAIAAVIGDDFLPDVTIGRIPARRAGDVDAYRAKLQAYETQAGSPWMTRVQLFADDDVNDDRSECGVPGAAAADFDQLVAQYLPAADPQNVIQRYSGAYRGFNAPQDLQAAVIADLNAGMGVQIYLGHGNVVSLGRHCDNNQFSILNRDVLPTVANGSRLAFGVAMTCEAGEFDIATVLGTETVTSSVAESYLMAPDRGHVAWLATTSVLAFATGVDLTGDLFSVLYAGDPVGPPENRVAGSIALGVALRRFAEAGAGARDAVSTLVVLGDPGARLRATTP